MKMKILRLAVLFGVVATLQISGNFLINKQKTRGVVK